MPGGNCDVIEKWYEEAVERGLAAAAAETAAGEAEALAGAALAAALTWAGSCFYLVEAPPAFAICEVPAVAAVVAATAAVAYYEWKREQAKEDLAAVEAAIATLDDLLLHCVETASWQEGARVEAIALADAAFQQMSELQIEDIDLELLEEAESAADEAEQAVAEAEAVAAEETGQDPSYV